LLDQLALLDQPVLLDHRDQLALKQQTLMVEFQTLFTVEALQLLLEELTANGN
jgi:hypothetical protein